MKYKIKDINGLYSSVMDMLSTLFGFGGMVSGTIALYNMTFMTSEFYSIITIIAVLILMYVSMMVIKMDGFLSAINYFNRDKIGEEIEI